MTRTECVILVMVLVAAILFGFVLGVIYERGGIEVPDIPANFTTPNGNGGGSTHCIDPITHEAVGDESGTAG